jgi:uncharacterized protein (TIGR02147 family)
MSDSPDILTYNDYRRFLADLYAARKAVQKKYSYRRFSEDLGFQSSNYLHLIVTRKRNLSLEGISRIKQHLPDWQAREKNYFQTLVLFNQATSTTEGLRLRQELDKILRKKRVLLGSDQDAYFSTWYIPVIRELFSFKSFISNLNWISRKLRPHVPEDLVKEALLLLERLGMIVKSGGKWVQNHKHLTTAAEVTSDMIHGYHQEMLKLSQGALAHPAGERDISAMTMSLTLAQFAAIKQKVVDFRDDLQQELQEQGADNPTLVGQLNIQLFKVTEN